VYIPLGGNRGSEWATSRNLFITMVACGLWHGAAMPFIVFGALHGATLVVERQVYSREFLDDRRPYTRPDIVPNLVTFLLWSLFLMVFRAPNFSSAFDYLKGMLAFRPGTIGLDELAVFSFACAVMLIVDIGQRVSNDHLRMLTWSSITRGIAYAVMLVTIVVYSGGTPVPFYYFRF
jgi:alginate O-acetyltransferase complex protein AlgI